MSRIDPPFKNLIASLRQLVFYNYDVLEDYFKTSFRLANETTSKIELKTKEWDNKIQITNTLDLTSTKAAF